MENVNLMDLFLFTIPSLITGVIAYYFFKEHTKNEDGRRSFLLKKDLQINSMPLRLQAYERMALFLERITPAKLLVRVPPISSNKHDYEALLIQSIEQEFEHNLSQQIYISEQCWNVIIASKNATIQFIRKTCLSETIDSSNELRETLLKEIIQKQTPSDTALAFIKNEVSDIW